MDRIVAYNGATTGIIYCLHISVGRAVKNGIPLSTDYNNIGNLLGSLIKYIYRAGRRAWWRTGNERIVRNQTHAHAHTRARARSSNMSSVFRLHLYELEFLTEELCRTLNLYYFPRTVLKLFIPCHIILNYNTYSFYLSKEGMGQAKRTNSNLHTYSRSRPYARQKHLT